MAHQTITDFINNFGGGIRPNRFRVTGKLGNTDNTEMTDKQGTFHIRSASLPASSVGAVAINYRGRTVNFPGDRTYAPWDIVILDENPNETKTGKTLFKAFHEWSNIINDHVNNTTTKTNPVQHFTDNLGTGASNTWTVELLDVNGITAIRRFKLYNCWPVAVGALQLDMGQDNTVASFAVRLVFSHMEYVQDSTLPTN
jgi:hypothetical protein